jgi:hypothetical protein
VRLKAGEPILTFLSSWPSASHENIEAKRLSARLEWRLNGSSVFFVDANCYAYR